MSTIHVVKEIYIYPIKSLAGISCQTALAEEMGFENDRRWMLIDAENKHITQREYPIMSQFYPQISDGKISISFEDHQHEFSLNENLNIPIKSHVWEDETEVTEVSKSTSEWFSKPRARWALDSQRTRSFKSTTLKNRHPHPDSSCTRQLISRAAAPPCLNST